MLGWVTRVLSVVASGLPVFTLLVGLVATGSALYASYKGVCAVSIGVAVQIGSFADDIKSIFESFEFGAGSTNSSMLSAILRMLSIDTLMEYAGTLTQGFATVLALLAGIFATITTAAIALWVYRKSILFANIATGVGVHDA